MMRISFTLFFVLVVTIGWSQKPSEAPSRKHFWHTVSTTASPESIWAIWTDVSNWHTWDTGLKKAYMEEAFGLEATGVLTSLEGRDTKFTVVAYEEGRSCIQATQGQCRL
ncbi:MAG: hypothetical protein AAFP88_03320, partial [Bacteroidota bacterium]